MTVTYQLQHGQEGGDETSKEMKFAGFSMHGGAQFGHDGS